MRKQFILAFLIAVVPVITHAQRFTDIRAGFHLGYNSYSMGEFKNFEKGSVSAIQRLVPMKTMQNYPNRGSLGASLNFTYRETENGIKYMYHSSGSRHHYGDYSGEIGLDAIMTSHAVSGETSFIFNSSDNVWYLFIGMAGTNHFGTYRIGEFLRSEQNMTRSSIKFSFHTLTLEPFVKLHREFGQHIVLFKVGYDLHILSTVYYQGDSVSFTSNNKKAKAEMTGFRAEIGYQIRLGSRLK
jgi:hypothetical protein